MRDKLQRLDADHTDLVRCALCSYIGEHTQVHVLFEAMTELENSLNFFFAEFQALCVHKESMQSHSHVLNICSEDRL